MKRSASKNEGIERNPGKQDGRKDNYERPRASKSRNLIGESLSDCQLLLKFQIGIVADLPAFTEMLNNPMFTFRKVIKADLKPPLHKISQLILHSIDPQRCRENATPQRVNSKAVAVGPVRVHSSIILDWTLVNLWPPSG